MEWLERTVRAGSFLSHQNILLNSDQGLLLLYSTVQYFIRIEKNSVKVTSYSGNFFRFSTIVLPVDYVLL